MDCLMLRKRAIHKLRPMTDSNPDSEAQPQHHKRDRSKATEKCSYPDCENHLVKGQDETCAKCQNRSPPRHTKITPKRLLDFELCPFDCGTLYDTKEELAGGGLAKACHKHRIEQRRNGPTPKQKKAFAKKTKKRDAKNAKKDKSKQAITDDSSTVNMAGVGLRGGVASLCPDTGCSDFTTDIADCGYEEQSIADFYSARDTDQHSDNSPLWTLLVRSYKCATELHDRVRELEWLLEQRCRARG